MGENGTSTSVNAKNQVSYDVESFTPTAELMQLWDAVKQDLRGEFGEAIYRSWLRALTLQAYYHGTMEVSAPTRFIRDWVQNNYSEQILAFCTSRNVDIKRVELVVVQGPIQSEVAPAEADAAQPLKANNNLKTAAPAKEADSETTLLEELSSPLDPRFTFESFVVGKPNALAHAAARRVCESSNVPFNPLFIYGGVGLGKTHLMHAIAWAMKEHKPDVKILYLSAEKFMYQFVKALRSKDTMAFKALLRSVDVLMMDDIQFIAGKESTQEEFFHTFNALVDQNKQIIISADRAPQDVQGLDERLRSRLSWGLVADIQPSTYDLRLGILKSKCAMMGIEAPESVLEFLALKITSSIRELEGALNRLLAHTDVSGQAITLEETQNVLKDLLRAHDRRITIDEIQRKVAEHFSLRLADMHSPRRARQVARPRQIAMFLCKQLTPRSLPEIGRKFGGRDHTTVMHAVRKVDELIAEDPQIAKDVEIVRRTLTG